MTKKEKILNTFSSKLSMLANDFIDSKEKFGNEYVLNSNVLKDSVFEKSTPVTSEFQVYYLDRLPLAEIMLGDVTEVIMDANIKVATFHSPPKKGKELNNVSSTRYHVKLTAKVSYDKNNDEIEVLSIDMR